MSMILIKSGVINEYDCLKVSDLNDIPVAKIPAQSNAFVYNIGKLCYLDNDGAWKVAGTGLAPQDPVESEE